MRKQIAEQPHAYHKAWKMGDDGVLRHRRSIYVANSAAARNAILKRCHDDDLAGHFGVERTFWMIHRKFY